MTKNYTILDQSFFNRNTLDVAQDLLGKYLVRSINNQEIALLINEVEAYDGPHDLACHARVGKTARTDVMFGPAGHFYVYLIYGMYHMLNIVTGPEEYPAAILIRGVGVFDGPGKLTKNLGINQTFNKKIVAPETGLWVEDRGIVIREHDILATPRIGVAYAGPEWSQKLYRFILKTE
jgi:DNA-3-methyladenine glycosylase